GPCRGEGGPDRDGRPRRSAGRAGLLRAGRQRSARPVSDALLGARAPRALRGFALALLGVPLAGGLIELPLGAEPVSGLVHRRLDPRHLLERLGRPHALERLGGPGQVGTHALEVLRRGRRVVAQPLPLGAVSAPVARGGVEILALLPGQVAQRRRVTRDLLGRLGEAPPSVATLQGGPARGDLVTRDLLGPLLLVRDPALLPLDVLDALVVGLERGAVALADRLPLPGPRVGAADQRDERAPGQSGEKP